MAGPKKKGGSSRSTVSGKAKTLRKRQKIKAALEKGEIKEFADIFEVYMRETPFALLIGMQKKQLVVKVKDPEKFTFKHCTRISKEFDVDFDIVVHFIASLVKAKHRPSANKGKST